MKKLTPQELANAIDKAFHAFLDPKHNPDVSKVDSETLKKVASLNTLLTHFIIAQVLREMDLLDITDTEGAAIHGVGEDL